RITVNVDGTRTLRHKDGRAVTFAASPGSAVPIAVTDANGNRVTITRDTNWAIRAITDATGRGWTFTRFDPSFDRRVGSVTDPLGRTVTYEYYPTGLLSRVTNPAGGVTQYFYDAQYRMTSITDARGITYLTNTYDANYRVCQQAQADGGVFTMYYITTDIATAPASVPVAERGGGGGPDQPGLVRGSRLDEPGRGHRPGGPAGP